MIVIKNVVNAFHFYLHGLENLDRNKVKPCECCDKMVVSNTYYKIIKQLKEAGLLDKDYKLQCCVCYKTVSRWE